jgi:hypothetical protein
VKQVISKLIPNLITRVTHNSYTIIIDVCLFVKLILELSVFDNRPGISISSCQSPRPATDLLDTTWVQGSLVDSGRDHDGRVEISEGCRMVVGSSLGEDLRARALLVGIWIGARSTFDLVGRRTF